MGAINMFMKMLIDDYCIDVAKCVHLTQLLMSFSGYLTTTILKEPFPQNSRASIFSASFNSTII